MEVHGIVGPTLWAVLYHIVNWGHLSYTCAVLGVIDSHVWCFSCCYFYAEKPVALHLCLNPTYRKFYWVDSQDESPPSWNILRSCRFTPRVISQKISRKLLVPWLNHCSNFESQASRGIICTMLNRLKVLCVSGQLFSSGVISQLLEGATLCIGDCELPHVNATNVIIPLCCFFLIASDLDRAHFLLLAIKREYLFIDCREGRDFVEKKLFICWRLFYFLCTTSCFW